MTKVLFIWPPKIEYIFSIQKHYTNFGETVAYLDAQNDVEVDVMDGSALMYFQWNFIEAYSKEYDFMVVYTDLHNSISAIKAAHQCKEISPKTTIISYGQGTPYAPDIYIDQGFDAAVHDPMYQKSIADFISYKQGEVSKRMLKGISFKEKGSLVSIRDTHELDVAEVAFPALDKLPIGQYKQISGRDQVCFTVTRGCPYPCRFCRVPIDQGRKVSYRPVPDVVAYLKQVKDDFASIKLIAPTFTIDRDWVLELCSTIKEENLDVKWIVTTRLELLDHELLNAMSNAGCIAIAFGLETLYTSTQNRVDKQLEPEVVIKQVELIHSYGIIPKAFIMLGIPGQTREEIVELYDFLQKHRVEIRPKEYYPYETLLSSNDKIELLQKFERENVYNNRIPGVHTMQFVKWLSNRTSVR